MLKYKRKGYVSKIIFLHLLHKNISFFGGRYQECGPVYVWFVFVQPFVVAVDPADIEVRKQPGLLWLGRVLSSLNMCLSILLSSLLFSLLSSILSTFLCCFLACNSTPIYRDF